MSYNTRRGNIAFNKNISSSSVGQRRPIVTNNYVQQQNQATPQRQQPLQPSAQLQLAKQQQMLVQKKQQLAQQQRQQLQKQQLVQQKQQLANKPLENLAQQKKEQNQRDLEIQKQKELEQQKLKELHQMKQAEVELQNKIKVEQEHLIKLEQEHQMKLESQKQVELENQKQQELEQQMKLQKQLELEQQTKCDLEQVKDVDVKQEQGQQIHTEVDISKEQPEVVIIEDQLLTLPVLKENEENVAGNKPERKKWSTRRKLSKYEIQRRRNSRLGKLLQPKNAMVVLNEIVKNVTYVIDDCLNAETPLYRATAVVDGIEHVGSGQSKIAAKNIAAENALKYLIKHKKLMQTPKPSPNTSNQGETEPMDTTEHDTPLAWQQFASFAVYKLLTTWGEDPNSIREEAKINKKPSKKIPENAHLMHPLMLLNQMIPHVHFEELTRSLIGHNCTYTYKCTLDGQTFVGSGTSKKSAKKQAAFEICKNVLGVEYPPELNTTPIPTSV